MDILIGMAGLAVGLLLALLLRQRPTPAPEPPPLIDPNQDSAVALARAVADGIAQALAAANPAPVTAQPAQPVSYDQDKVADELYIEDWTNQFIPEDDALGYIRVGDDVTPVLGEDDEPDWDEL